MLVNVVSQIPAAIWNREVPPQSSLEYVHTRDPVSADIHVIYGLREKLSIPNAPDNVVFVASEPPEIRRYNLAILTNYRLVVGPRFGYLNALANYRPLTAVAPWWVGTSAGASKHYEQVSESAGYSRKQLSEGFAPEIDRVAAIVSNKAQTPLQQQRLRLVDYLLRHCADFEAFGLEHLPVQDKSEVLSQYRYHLAVENSIHHGYWTEKLSDAVLMDNYLFYRGDPSLSDYFSMSSIRRINPWDFEETYALIMQSIESGQWSASAEARLTNRRLLLDRWSFHRELESLLSSMSLRAASGRVVKIPAQHPKSRLKPIIDPVYRAVRRLI